MIMRKTLACLATVALASFALDWYLGWHNIVGVLGWPSHSRLAADDSQVQTGPGTEKADQRVKGSHDRKSQRNDSDTVSLMEPDIDAPIPRPFLRPVNGQGFPP